MVRLTSITTKSGDGGQTGLGDGTRVSKTHQRIQTLGEIDELNASVGVVLTTNLNEPYRDWLLQVQNDLFDLGGDLCFPPTENSPICSLFSKTHIDRLDSWLDQLHPLLSPLESFILPGGGPASAFLHWSRTVCRRTERSLLALAEHEAVPEQTVIYLNRLSDLMFQLARVLEDPSQPAPLWKPSRK